jgi:hypothetical protein
MKTSEENKNTAVESRNPHELGACSVVLNAYLPQGKRFKAEVVSPISNENRESLPLSLDFRSNNYELYSLIFSGKETKKPLINLPIPPYSGDDTHYKSGSEDIEYEIKINPDSQGKPPLLCMRNS